MRKNEIFSEFSEFLNLISAELFVGFNQRKPITAAVKK